MKRSNTKIFENVTTVFLILMSTVFLLAFDGSGYERISAIKTTLFYVICGGYVGLILLLLPEHLLVGSLKMSQVWRLIYPDTLVQKLSLIYLGLSVVSAAISPHNVVWLGGARKEGVLTIAIYVLCFYFVSKFFVADSWLLHVFGGSISIFSIICILQLVGFDPFSLYPDGYNYFDAYTAYSGAYLGTIGNVDFVAAFLCVAIPLLAVGIFKLKGKARFWLLLPIGLATVVLFWMKVLAGLLGVLLGAVICTGILLPIGKRGRALYFGLLALGVLGGTTFLYFADIGQGFLHELHLILHGQMQETFGSGRIYIWQNVWERVGERIWFGHGPDTLSLAGIEPFKRFDEALNIQIVATIDSAHNEYLNILYHQGVFALAAYVMMIGCSVVQFVRLGKERSVIAVTGSAVICYCVQAFFGVSQPLTTPYFWIVLGLINTKNEV